MNLDSLRRYLLGCVLLMAVSGNAVHAAAPYKDEAAPALPAGTSTNWWSQVQRDLSAREYHASATGEGIQAPNRAQGFRTYFDMGGIRVVERGAEPRELLRLRLSEFGGEPAACMRRTQWWASPRRPIRRMVRGGGWWRGKT